MPLIPKTTPNICLNHSNREIHGETIPCPIENKCFKTKTKKSKRKVKTRSSSSFMVENA
ncbi:hypothetical protein JHK82_055946 [Glycine max]|uniref:Uncharacterized protein n=1 Tax=Glycine max TaxID=3847 RepID=K7N2I9_SOYBN|nr:hypothetical protein JHK85_056785 [Glycine max]KAG5077251.1 hypothetical protein JHK82_055946 [Glycine max]KAH1035320.1 hypothetical protein GYH30_055340 [Glycine max]